MYPEQWFERFTRIVSQPEAQINLAEAALVIAADEYPELDVARYLAQLDAWAEHIRDRVETAPTPRDKVNTLNVYLFEELGFKGNREAYYDPRNSYLNDVLERRLGIPILLSIVYLEIGWRLGLPVGGVAMPGHFIVRYKTDDLVILIDPFEGGHVIGQFPLPQPADVLARLNWIQSASPSQILARLLNNLRVIFVQEEAHLRAYRAVEKILLLQPNAPDVLREAGLLAYHLKLYQRAHDHFDAYLRHFAHTKDAEIVRARLQQVEQILLRLN